MHFPTPQLQQWETQDRQAWAWKCQRGTHDQQELAVVDVSALKRCQEEDADMRPVLSLKAWYDELSVFPHFTKELKAGDPATITLSSLIGVGAQSKWLLQLDCEYVICQPLVHLVHTSDHNMSYHEHVKVPLPSHTLYHTSLALTPTQSKAWAWYWRLTFIQHLSSKDYSSGSKRLK